MTTRQSNLIGIAGLACIAGLAASPLSAQSTSVSGKKPAVTASLVPIGANSDSYWVGDGPGMRAIPLDPEAAPPATLCIRHRGSFKVIPGILNRPSIALPVAGGVLRVYANQETVENEEPPLFGNFKIPTVPGHYDVFLNRSNKQEGWNEPDSMVLSSSTASFPPGTFRLINLSAEPIKAKIGATTIDLAPRRVKVIPSAAGGPGKLLAIQAAHINGNDSLLIIRTGIRLLDRQRANIIFYPGRDPKKPCKATWFYQSDPELDPNEKGRTTP